LADNLLLEVSEALGVSLFEVRTQYFGGSDEVEGDQVVAEEWDCHESDVPPFCFPYTYKAYTLMDNQTQIPLLF
jgi:hypothetical protein